MVAPAQEGIDLFKIAGRSISGWIPSLKTGTASHVRQPFCTQLEERLLLWLEYNPQVSCYARGDIGPQLGTTYRLPTLKHVPFALREEATAHAKSLGVVVSIPGGMDRYERAFLPKGCQFPSCRWEKRVVERLSEVSPLLSADASRRLLTLRPKTCSLFALITKTVSKYKPCP